MALLKIHQLGDEQAWALWKITESEAQLTSISPESCPINIVHPQKRLEWLAARCLVSGILASFKLGYFGLRKDEFGKPFLIDHPHQISLSHSYPYVAVQIDREKPVGIDLEQPKEKLRNIAPRVFSKTEVEDGGDNITKLCVYWCAKEALYKIYGKRNLLFSNHLLVAPFTLSDTGIINGTIALSEHSTLVRLEYLVIENFVVVWTAAQR